MDFVAYCIIFLFSFICISMNVNKFNVSEVQFNVALHVYNVELPTVGGEIHPRYLIMPLKTTSGALTKHAREL